MEKEKLAVILKHTPNYFKSESGIEKEIITSAIGIFEENEAWDLATKLNKLKNETGSDCRYQALQIENKDVVLDTQDMIDLHIVCPEKYDWPSEEDLHCDWTSKPLNL